MMTGTILDEDGKHGDALDIEKVDQGSKTGQFLFLVKCFITTVVQLEKYLAKTSTNSRDPIFLKSVTTLGKWCTIDAVEKILTPILNKDLTKQLLKKLHQK
jgi:hypothetical protein